MRKFPISIAFIIGHRKWLHFFIPSARIFIFQVISDRICFFRLLTNKNNANWPWRLILFGHESHRSCTNWFRLVSFDKRLRAADTLCAYRSGFWVLSLGTGGANRPVECVHKRTRSTRTEFYAQFSIHQYFWHVSAYRKTKNKIQERGKKKNK